MVTVTEESRCPKWLRQLLIETKFLPVDIWDFLIYNYIKSFDMPSIEVSKELKGEMWYPLSCIEEGWKSDNVDCAKLGFGELKELLNVDNFSHFYFWRPGERDEECWTFLVRHSNGLYVHFNAGFCYTGFEWGGFGWVAYAKDIKKLWDYGMTNSDRDLILCAVEVQ